MANVTTGFKNVETITTTKVPTYTLTLDATEAQMVRALAGRVGGDGEYRKAASRVYTALCNASFASDATYLLEGSIKFVKGGLGLTW